MSDGNGNQAVNPADVIGQDLPPGTELVETQFSFRTDSETKVKRPSLSLSFPVPTAAQLIEHLKNPDDKAGQLVKDLAAETIYKYLRGFVDNDVDYDQNKLNILISEGKVNLETIATLPRSERNVLSKEDLENFAKDYIAVMPQLTGKELKKVQAAAGLFVERFKRVAGDNAILAKLSEQMGIFMEKAPTEVVAKHEKALEYLGKKLEELLSIKMTADAL